MARLTPSHRIRRMIRKRDSSFHPSHDRYRWWLLANVMIGTFMAVLDSTIVNVGLPKIMASFGVGIDRIEWVLTAYMLALAVALPTSGWLADRFGYKRMYFWGLLLFTVGSFLCGVSNDENMLVFSRIIQGLGAGCLMPLGMAIITREFPPEQRGVALGFWGISAAASVSFGPLIGGYLVDNFTWQLIFDVNVPVGIMGMVATIVIQKEFVSPRRRKFDYIGFFSISTFLPVILYGLTEGSSSTNTAGWSAPYVLACFAISIVALAVFITNELIVSDPIIDLRLLTDRNFGLSNLIMFIFSIGMFGSTFLMPQYLQNSLNYTAIMAGSVFLPVGIIQGIMAPLAGVIGNKTNPKIPVFIGVVLLAISFFLNGYLSYLSEHNFIMISLYLRGFAMGLMFTPLSTIAMIEIPREKMAQASGLLNTIRQLGASFGVAIFATIMTTRINFHNQMYGQSVDSHSQVFSAISGNISNYLQQNAGSTVSNAIKQGQTILFSHIGKEAYIQGIDDDFLLAGVVTVIGIIPIFWLHVRKKQSEKLVRHVHPIKK